MKWQCSRISRTPGSTPSLLSGRNRQCRLPAIPRISYSATRQSPSPRGFRPRNLILKFGDGDGRSVLPFGSTPSHLFLFFGFSQGGVSARTIISSITSLVLFKFLFVVGASNP